MKELEIILKPAITEKATAHQAKGKYVVVIRPDATKVDVANAFQSLYGVTVDKVNILKTRAKFRSGGRRGTPLQKRHPAKRAIVTVAEKKEVNLLKPKGRK